MTISIDPKLPLIPPMRARGVRAHVDEVRFGNRRTESSESEHELTVWASRPLAPADASDSVRSGTFLKTREGDQG